MPPANRKSRHVAREIIACRAGVRRKSLLSADTAFLADLIPGGIDAGHLVICLFDEFGRHALGDQGIGMVFALQFAMGGF